MIEIVYANGTAEIVNPLDDTDAGNSAESLVESGVLHLADGSAVLAGQVRRINPVTGAAEEGATVQNDATSIEPPADPA